jgi:inositol 1,4,5-triphosphate receptor type 1
MWEFYSIAIVIEQNLHIIDVISEDVNSQVTASGGEVKERACDSLVMCIVTTLNQGLRNGGGIGDILRAPSSTVSWYL